MGITGGEGKLEGIVLKKNQSYNFRVGKNCSKPCRWIFHPKCPRRCKDFMYRETLKNALLNFTSSKEKNKAKMKPLRHELKDFGKLLSNNNIKMSSLTMKKREWILSTS